MQLVVNGDSLEAPDGTTVAGLLSQLGLEGRPCAVEVNQELTPKSDHTQRTLAPGDRVEVVTLVGGG